MNENDILLIPTNIIKLLNDLNTLRTLVIEKKKTADEIFIQFNLTDKKISKYLNKEINIILKKSKKNKKPKGFAIPTDVSDTLCIFMKQPINTKISRTNATKYLMEYIKINNLIDINNKKIIVPDNNLLELIGNTVELENPLDRFNIQKYLNKHFTVIK